MILLLAALDIPQKPKDRFAAVGFYNMDNFFDTIKDARNDDAAYLPSGIKRWTGWRYRYKLERMAFAISQVAAKDVERGLAVLGVCEVENRRVLEDLTLTPPLNAMQWGIVHYDSPDRRGLDVALLYQRDRFQVLASRSIPLRIAGNPSFRSRAQLLVTGRLDGEIIHFIVAHYPLRGNCEGCTKNLRVAAARLTLNIVNFLLSKDNNAKIIIMGDFNDNPSSYSIARMLNAQPTIKETPQDGLFNAFYPLYKDGARSVFYRNEWHLFDQQIVSYPLLQTSGGGGFKLYQATVFNAPFLVDKYTAGRPAHTFARGFSKHFPTYLVLINENVKKPQRKGGKKSSRTYPQVSTTEWTMDTSYSKYIFGEEIEVTFTDSIKDPTFPSETLTIGDTAPVSRIFGKKEGKRADSAPKKGLRNLFKRTPKTPPQRPTKVLTADTARTKQVFGQRTEILFPEW